LAGGGSLRTNSASISAGDSGDWSTGIYRLPGTGAGEAAGVMNLSLTRKSAHAGPRAVKRARREHCRSPRATLYPRGSKERGRGVGWDGWIYRGTAALAAVTLALVIAHIWLVQDNRAAQAEVNRRQIFINQSIQLGRVNEALVRALAAAAVDAKDDKLRDLLTQNGITVNPPAKAPAAAETEKPQ
jgi:hypothetical protein